MGSKVATPFTIREAVSRFFPGGDKQRADQLIRWLDACGYVIVDREAVRDDNAPSDRTRSKAAGHGLFMPDRFACDQSAVGRELAAASGSQPSSPFTRR
jgi:hypothetical protein